MLTEEGRYATPLTQKSLSDPQILFKRSKVKTMPTEAQVSARGMAMADINKESEESKLGPRAKTSINEFTREASPMKQAKRIPKMRTNLKLG